MSRWSEQRLPEQGIRSVVLCSYQLLHRCIPLSCSISIYTHTYAYVVVKWPGERRLARQQCEHGCCDGGIASYDKVKITKLKGRQRRKRRKKKGTKREKGVANNKWMSMKWITKLRMWLEVCKFLGLSLSLWFLFVSSASLTEQDSKQNEVSVWDLFFVLFSSSSRGSLFSLSSDTLFSYDSGARERLRSP